MPSFRLSFFGVLVGLAPALAHAGDAAGLQVPSPLPLAWCLERAAQESPRIAARVASADGARERVIPAGALEDPRLRYEASNVPDRELDFRSTPLSGQQLGLSQRFPFPGLLRRREDAARSAARAAEAGVGDLRLRVAAAVEQAWAELGFAQRALQITAQNLELLRQLARIAESKYAVGSGLQQDVLRAQVALTGLLDEQLRRRAAVTGAEAALAELLDLPPDLPLPRTEPLEEQAPLPRLAELLDALEATSPRLLALRERVAEAEQLRGAAELEGRPDFDVGLGYRIRKNVVGDAVDGANFLSAGVTIRLPVNRARWNARVAERGAAVRGLRADYRGLRAELRRGVRTRFAALERADAEVALVRDGLVPQAHQLLESNRSGYEVDKVDFLRLVDSQVSLFDAELRLVRAAADRRSARAALEAVSGRPLR